MSTKCRVLKVGYSNELSTESAMWMEKYIESILIEQIVGKDITKLHLLLMHQEEKK